MLKQKVLKLMNRYGYLVHEQKLFHTKYQPRSYFIPLEQLFYKFLHKDFFFVQIGANDGVRFDPIYHLVTKEKVNGVVLEPLSDLYKELVENYKNYPGILPVNKAVHANEKVMTLYRVNREKDYPEWTKGTASFKKDHHKLGNIKDADIIEERVQCFTWGELIKEYRID
ncbi:MAG: hypothetical protein EOP48_32405, partial [Sphingobacteriales bacterium]